MKLLIFAEGPRTYFNSQGFKTESSQNEMTISARSQNVAFSFFFIFDITQLWTYAQ